MKIQLGSIAHARSGDKGDLVNIGVIAYRVQDYEVLLREVTAERVKARVDASGMWKKSITTSIEAESTWWRGEEYHQDYLQKNPGGYSCHWMRD